MNTIGIYSNTSSAILNFVKNLVSKKTYKDISLLLHPCCKPTVTLGTLSCGSLEGVQGVLFTGVTVSDPALANKSVQLILSAPEYLQHGGIQNATLDAKGFWTGNIQTSFEGASKPNPYTLSLTLTIIPDTLDVVRKSEVQVITTVINCD